MDIEIAEATPSDIQGIIGLIGPYVERGIVLPRSKEELAAKLDVLMVARYNSSLVGVISFFDYGPELKEIRTLVVDKTISRKGVGTLLLRKLIDKLKVKKNIKIFALSYTPQFFIANGFIEVEKKTLPEKIWKDCNKCKNRETCGETPLVLVE